VAFDIHFEVTLRERIAVHLRAYLSYNLAFIKFKQFTSYMSQP